MDLIHNFINVVLPILTFFLSIIILPLLILFKLLNYIRRALLAEELAGKVVIITGASSGIGEYMAYEYAKRGACLALVARREDVLRVVAGKAKQLGSPDVIVIAADVSKVEDSKRFVDVTIKHFGRLDHLINNAGVATLFMFEELKCVTDYAYLMDINFWGSVYSTQFALPYLRKSKGKVIVISSCGEWYATPRLSIYNASKAALVSFYETLRAELGSDIGITIVTPGIIKSNITNSDWAAEVNMKFIPEMSTEGCAKAIVNSARRGDKYFTTPFWMQVLFLGKVVFPEAFEWINRLLVIWGPKTHSQCDASLARSLSCIFQDINI